ncbi:hypothetical protein [Streptomyces sp. CC208A]|uniref:hypothetical protein n=1 Tax=Streptomyces sp. CC208A TaxID=3044573 RepID=UPI0024A97636|nr:hypothetical protein [Streptomyces sp. CC208A]
MTQNGQGPEQGGAQAWGGAWGPAGGPPQPGGQPLPPAQPLPPEAPPAGDLQATQYIAPVPPQGGAGAMPPAGPPAGYGYPPPAAPPMGPPAGYGYPPPVADLQATQHMAPIPPQGGAGAGGQTQFLGTGRLPQQPPAPAGASDATQYIAPVPGGPIPGGPVPGGPVPGGPVPGGPVPSQPPAEFDSLFRDSAPAQPAPPAYQQPAPAPYPPQHQQPHQPPQQQYGYQAPGGYQQGGHDAYDDYYADEPAPRRKSPVALIAAVVVGCAAVGLTVGAMLSGGDDDEKTPTAGQSAPPSSQAPAPSDGASETPEEKKPDPAEPQAKELDKLLATSNSSRDTVISSVELIKQCKDLDKAAADLRGAAQQRRGLVTRLQALSVDKIPNNAALTSALTRAWQASASADDHYAAWAVQVKKDKKACKDGQAKSTNHFQAANNKSGEATTAKKEAAKLWNPTADKYGLDRRGATQL